MRDIKSLGISSENDSFLIHKNHFNSKMTFFCPVCELPNCTVLQYSAHNPPTLLGLFDHPPSSPAFKSVKLAILFLYKFSIKIAEEFEANGIFVSPELLSVTDTMQILLLILNSAECNTQEFRQNVNHFIRSGKY
jgi:hypothetical protein